MDQLSDLKVLSFYSYFWLIFIISNCSFKTVLNRKTMQFNSFASWINKVTTGTKSFVLVIVNFIAPVAEEITQYADQVRMRLISQLTKSISRVLQKLLKYFNDTAI